MQILVVEESVVVVHINSDLVIWRWIRGIPREVRHMLAVEIVGELEAVIFVLSGAGVVTNGWHVALEQRPRAGFPFNLEHQPRSATRGDIVLENVDYSPVAHLALVVIIDKGQHDPSVVATAGRRLPRRAAKLQATQPHPIKLFKHHCRRKDRGGGVVQLHARGQGQRLQRAVSPASQVERKTH